MKCRQVFDLLDSYIDEGLDPMSTSLVREHLGSCSQCSNEWNLRRELGYLMKNGSPVKAPEGFTEQVMAAIQGMAVQYSGNLRMGMEASYNAIYRRLGYSMLLAAAVMLLTISLPYGKYNVMFNPVNEQRINLTEKTQRLSDTFDQFGSGMRSMFTSFNNFVKQ
jgi:anti-sigma factor RsiW